jgi:hypothetical protein
MRPPDNDECRPPGRERHPENDPTKITTDSVSESDDWLVHYPEWVREAVRMDKRRRAASLRMVPLPSGKRDPWDLIARDGSEAA